MSNNTPDNISNNTPSTTPNVPAIDQALLGLFQELDAYPHRWGSLRYLIRGKLTELGFSELGEIYACKIQSLEERWQSFYVPNAKLSGWITRAIRETIKCDEAKATPQTMAMVNQIYLELAKIQKKEWESINEKSFSDTSLGT